LSVYAGSNLFGEIPNLRIKITLNFQENIIKKFYLLSRELIN